MDGSDAVLNKWPHKHISELTFMKEGRGVM